MFVLIDTREVAKAKVLNHDSIEEAERWAFADLSEEEKDECKTLEYYQESLGGTQYYQESLGGTQWYHVVEAE